VKDIIDHARKSRGRFGVANPASLERQAAERLRVASKINAAVVSHEGGGDLMINVLNGTLDAGVGEIQELRAQLAGNKLRLLGTFTEQRLSDFPDLPTIKEQGFDVVVHKFRGLAGPKGLSPEIIAVWEKAVPQLLADAEYKKVYAQESLIVDFRGSVAATQLVNTFAAESEAFLKETGVIK
jgi:tripartite-type tricarboxylate transporter receptor subunit TctC